MIQQKEGNEGYCIEPVFFGYINWSRFLGMATEVNCSAGKVDKVHRYRGCLKWTWQLHTARLSISTGRAITVLILE